jgi:maltooligosyltrehalose trehalohydrolase
MLIVNLGRDVNRDSFAEPLMAPPRGGEWAVEWSTEDPAYGGQGLPNLWPEDKWHIPGESAVVLKPVSEQRVRAAKKKRRTA